MDIFLLTCSWKSRLICSENMHIMTEKLEESETMELLNIYQYSDFPCHKHT